MDMKALALFGILTACVMLTGCIYSSGAANDSPFSTPAPMIVATVAPPGTPSPTVMPAATASATPTPSISSSSIETRPISTVAPDTSVQYNRTFDWTYNNVEWRFNVQISKAIYDFYKSSPHDKTPNYANYALTDEDKDFFRDITKKFKDNGASNGYTDYDNIMNVIAFVQALPYKEDDPATGEYTRYPLETLVDNAGDCKDKSILAATMLHEMGYDVVLLKYPQHMAVGVKLDRDISGTYFDYGGSRYYYAETTGQNWTIGDAPDDIKGLTPIIYPMMKNPKIEVNIDVKPAGADASNVQYAVHADLKNDGPGTAMNLKAHIYALALDRGDNVIWNPDSKHDLGDYAAGQTGSIEATLTIPAFKSTRIVCVITADNIDTNEQKTAVFQT